MALPKPHISVDNLRMGWGQRVLMERISFRVERGTVFAILGGSGSGKSTLLRYLIGLERPQAGRINIDGVGEPHQYEGVPPFGVLFQSCALFSSMTLAENLALPLTRWTSVRGATARELVQAKLDLVGLGAFAEHLPGSISGGMKKRAGMSCQATWLPQQAASCVAWHLRVLLPSVANDDKCGCCRVHSPYWYATALSIVRVGTDLCLY